MYSYNNLWEWGLGWVIDYGTLIKLSIWHQFMAKYYQYMTICIEIKRQEWLCGDHHNICYEMHIS